MLNHLRRDKMKRTQRASAPVVINLPWWLGVLTCLIFAGVGIADNPSDAHPQVTLRGSLVSNQLIAVYNNWSAYDELSDNIELTEALAMRELEQIVGKRVKKFIAATVHPAQQCALLCNSTSLAGIS